MVKHKKTNDISEEKSMAGGGEETLSERAPETEDKKADPVKELEEKLKQSGIESRQNYDRFLRVYADFENYKKRTARETSEFKKYANESLIGELLCVVDNLERAITSSEGNDKLNSCFIEGVGMTLKEILKVFENYGVKPIDSLCKAFDPNLHQAVMQQESGDHPANTVIAELQKGYMIHDRLLRPSMVIVSAAKKENNNI